MNKLKCINVLYYFFKTKTSKKKIEIDIN
uniref:Uncharacterized protein n=1 Tax=Anguilla anguilla TaxID=7936 RepID=A0A0E9T6B0_ANGAN